MTKSMNNYAKLLVVTTVSLLLLAGGLAALADESNQLTGREIIKKVYQRDTYEDRKSSMKMTLINDKGDEKVREIRQFERNFGEVDKKIMVFTSPRSVEGTAFMNWSYEDDSEDDQWLYMPALGSIRRIAGGDQSDRFMGSDFTYEDLGERTLDEDKHKLLREEKLNGKECYVVESVPKEEDYMYSKTITWVSKNNWIGLKKEFYDPDGELLKVLRVKDYEEIDGILTVTESEMHNVQEDHKTLIQLDDIEFNTGIPERKFTQRTMQRGL